MKETNWIDTVKAITMPTQMKEELIHNSLERKYSKKPLFCYSKLIIAAAAIALLVTISIPSYAAYDLYHTKNIQVFFETEISQEQIDAIGEELKTMEGIYAVKFISAEEAWESFATEYLTEELKAAFPENPLADSFNYQVTISLNANTKKVREQINRLEGVRHTSNLYELKE